MGERSLLLCTHMGWERRKFDRGFAWVGWNCAHCFTLKTGDHAWVQDGREFCNETCAAFYEIEKKKKAMTR